MRCAAGIYTVLGFLSVRGLFLIFILSPPSRAPSKKDQLDPMALLVRPLFTIAIIISAGWNAAGHSKYVLSVNHVGGKSLKKRERNHTTMSSDRSIVY